MRIDPILTVKVQCDAEGLYTVIDTKHSPAMLSAIAAVAYGAGIDPGERGLVVVARDPRPERFRGPAEMIDHVQPDVEAATKAAQICALRAAISVLTQLGEPGFKRLIDPLNHLIEKLTTKENDHG